MFMAVIYCSPQVRRLWPSPIAAQWASLYPQLFDQDDVRLTRLQPKNHFSEWFAAIHLFHRDGALSLVEKYVQNEALANALENTPGVNVLSAPKVSTLDGRQAQVKVGSLRTIGGETYELGPIVDIVPRVSPDGVSVDLTIIA